MVEGGRVNAHGTACIMEAINKTGHPELEKKVDDSEQTLSYITWRAKQEAKNQSLILQPVSGNGIDKKEKTKTETRHGRKEKPVNVLALKLIACYGADERAQLEEWKDIVMGGLTNKIA